MGLILDYGPDLAFTQVNEAPGQVTYAPGVEQGSPLLERLQEPL